MAQYRTNWEKVAEDPNLESDLGYDIADWEVIKPANGSKQLIFLPKDEEELRDDAFIVADSQAICDLIDRV